MAIHCSEHGKIVTLGRQVNYCPLCGRKTIPVFFFPRIYIDLAPVVTVGIIATVIGLLYLGVSALNRSSEEAHKERQQEIAALPPVWRNLYEIMYQNNASDEVELAQKFVEQNEGDLKYAPTLAQSDIKVILSGVDTTTNRAEVTKLIMRYTVGAGTGNPLR